MGIKLSGSFGSYYFIGICGVSMSALAKYMLRLGKKVGGSDSSSSPYAAELKSLGARINIGDSHALADYNVVVYTDAISADDAELRLARKLGKKVISRGKFLGEISCDFKMTIAVGGCHGKTTCTAMLASIFSAAGKKFAAHIGGNSIQFGNFIQTGNDYFITEACEYKKNLLYLRPDIAIVLSTDTDHLECYNGAEDLKKCYTKFASRAETAVCRRGELLCSGAVTFGIGEGADFFADEVRDSDGRYSFNLYRGKARLGEVSLNILGRHNVLNAVAAAAAAISAGIEFEYVKLGLESFAGVERRLEVIGTINGVTYIADYAHHPYEIKSAVRTVKKITGGNLYVVFQPHTYSRTKILFGGFVNALSGLRKLMVYRTFAAREYYDDAGSALTLAEAIKKCRYGEKQEDIEKFISSAENGDAVLFLGAGDIYFIAKDILNNLRPI